MIASGIANPPINPPIRGPACTRPTPFHSLPFRDVDVGGSDVRNLHETFVLVVADLADPGVGEGQSRFEWDERRCRCARDRGAVRAFVGDGQALGDHPDGSKRAARVR